MSILTPPPFIGLPLLKMAYLTSVFADAPTITLPAGLQDGDVGIFWDAAIADVVNGNYNTIPAGWELVLNGFTNGNSHNIHLRASIKVLTAAESSTSIAGSNYASTAGVRRKMVAVFRGSAPVSAVAAHNVVYSGSAGVPTDLALSTASLPAKSAKIACLGSRASSTHVMTNTPTETAKLTPNGTTMFFAYSLFGGVSAEDIVSAMTDGGNVNGHFGLYLSCVP